MLAPAGELGHPSGLGYFGDARFEGLGRNREVGILGVEGQGTLAPHVVGVSVVVLVAHVDGERQELWRGEGAR